jgi:hypothetical protein
MNTGVRSVHVAQDTVQWRTTVRTVVHKAPRMTAGLVKPSIRLRASSHVLMAWKLRQALYYTHNKPVPGQGFYAHFMEHNTSWEDNSFSVGQENSRMLCNPKVHTRVNKRPYPEPDESSTRPPILSLKSTYISSNLRLSFPSSLVPSRAFS